MILENSSPFIKTILIDVLHLMKNEKYGNKKQNTPIRNMIKLPAKTTQKLTLIRKTDKKQSRGPFETISTESIDILDNGINLQGINDIGVVDEIKKFIEEENTREMGILKTESSFNAESNFCP